MNAPQYRMYLLYVPVVHFCFQHSSKSEHSSAERQFGVTGMARWALLTATLLLALSHALVRRLPPQSRSPHLAMRSISLLAREEGHAPPSAGMGGVRREGPANPACPADEPDSFDPSGVAVAHNTLRTGDATSLQVEQVTNNAGKHFTLYLVGLVARRSCPRFSS